MIHDSRSGPAGLRTYSRQHDPLGTTRREPGAPQGSGRRSATAGGSRALSPTRGLADVIRFALAVLTDLHRLHPEVVNGCLEMTLRVAAEHAHATTDATGRTSAPADPARRATVRSACAFIAAGSYEDAYLALLEAETHFPPRRPDAADRTQPALQEELPPWPTTRTTSTDMLRRRPSTMPGAAV